MSSAPGQSLSLLRDAVYRLIDLEPPCEAPRVMTVSTPAFQFSRLSAHIVHATVTSDEVGVTASLSRYPVGDTRRTVQGPCSIRHLVVDVAESNPVLFQSAAVITRHVDTSTSPGGAFQPWAARTLAEYPGSRSAVIVDGASRRIVAFLRGRRPLIVNTLDVDESTDAIDPALFASVVYALDVTGCLTTAGTVQATLDVGGQKMRLAIWVSATDSTRATTPTQTG